jgi:hypothetical protein
MALEHEMASGRKTSGDLVNAAVESNVVAPRRVVASGTSVPFRAADFENPPAPSVDLVRLMAIKPVRMRAITR